MGDIFIQGPRRIVRWLAGGVAGALAMAALVAGCGGGVGSGGTGTYAAGPITGFGSIIVNGVRFDDSAAVVLDDDDVTRASADLRLGMTVAVDGGAIRTDTSGRSASANRIRFGSEVVGPVTAVDAGGGTMTVLGQTVRVAVETVFDDRLAGGLAGIAAGQIVEVYALYDAATSSYRATRIEPRTALTQYRLRGPVAALDATARTLRIGGATLAYGSASGVPADLAVGRVASVRLSTVVDASGRWVVLSFGAGIRLPENRDEAELKGLVTAWRSGTSFDVAGVPVDASTASFPEGSSGLRLGARVAVKGSSSAGVLHAREVTVESDDQVRDQGFEFKGMIESVDLASRTFVLRSEMMRRETISFARADLRLEGGTLSDLQAGRKVEVKAQLSADRTRLEATEIDFD